MSTIEKEFSKAGHVPADKRNEYLDLKRAESNPGAETAQRELRVQALKELGGDSGVFRGNQADIQNKMNEINAREAAENN